MIHGLKHLSAIVEGPPGARPAPRAGALASTPWARHKRVAASDADPCVATPAGTGPLRAKFSIVMAGHNTVRQRLQALREPMMRRGYFRRWKAPQPRRVCALLRERKPVVASG